MTNPIEKIFQGIGRNLPYSLFVSSDESFKYRCLQSTMENYTEDKVYSVYQIGPILRLIGKRLDLFTAKLQEKIQEKDLVLPVVLSWEENKKEILLISCEQKDLINEQLAELIEKTKPEMKQWISGKIGTNSKQASPQ